MHPVTWKVLNEEILKALLESGAQVQFVALTSNGYDNLALNMSELRRYMEQQKQIIIYYQNLTRGADIDSPDGKKWKFKDLIPGGEEEVPEQVETPPISIIIQNQKVKTGPLKNLDYLQSD